ncbi:SDR family oxidoreductase [Actinomadura sp. 21ATH]|uniref:SDR family oxidoreductase n=1 Tax=Actinomadura sp. 21ATH TaxID=1735444 RepID=UPI0035C0E889
MKIVVIGGSGLIGGKVVARLTGQGHEAVVATPRTGVNTLTGEGLAEVLKGAEVVVDVSNSPSFEAAAVMEFFTTSSRNVLAAEAEAGVRHHVALSVVGTSRLPDSGYFRAKVAQEELIAASPVPYSIVHATQFFEFAGAIADSATEGGTVRVPDALIQPIAADEVADAVTRAALGEPTRGITEVAGPESFTFEEMIERFFEARSDERKVVSDPEARYFGARLRERSLLPGDGAGIGGVRFADWLRASAK